MADDPAKRTQQDALRINLSQEHELRYWSEKFGVSKEKLAEAVRKAGPMAKDVEALLKR